MWLTNSPNFDSNSFNVASFQNNTKQSDCEFLMEEFADNKLLFLIATDVVTKRLDMIDLNYLISYDQTNRSEGHVRRISKTTRSNKTCFAYILFTLIEMRYSKKLLFEMSFRRNEPGSAYYVEIPCHFFEAETKHGVENRAKKTTSAP